MLDNTISYKDWLIKIYQEMNNYPNPFLEYDAKLINHNAEKNNDYKMRIHPSKKAPYDIIFYKSYPKDKLTIYIKNIIGYINNVIYSIECKNENYSFIIHNIHGKKNAYELAKEIINSFY